MMLQLKKRKADVASSGTPSKRQKKNRPEVIILRPKVKAMKEKWDQYGAKKFKMMEEVTEVFEDPSVNPLAQRYFSGPGAMSQWNHGAKHLSHFKFAPFIGKLHDGTPVMRRPMRDTG